MQAVIMASQQQITTNVARRTYLVSRHGFVLRVTEDAVESSAHGTSDPFGERYIIVDNTMDLLIVNRVITFGVYG